MKDVFGYELKVGDWVAYAVRSGNSGRLRIGKVKKITDEKKISIMGGDSYYSREWSVSGKMGNFSSPENIVKIDESIIPEDVRKLYD